MSQQQLTENEATKIYEKITKLLALSKSPNEHEAALAAERAQDLLLKYNLSLADIQTPGSQEEIGKHLVSSMPGGKKYHWCGTLLNGIATANFCKAVWTGSSLFVIGRKSNAAVCREMYLYLLEAIERVSAEAWKAWKKQTKPSGAESTRWYNSFVDGCTNRIYYRLMEIRKQQETVGSSDGSVSALVCVSLYQREDAAIEEFAAANLKIGKGSSSQKKTNLSAYSAGSKAGENISLNKQVKSGSQKLLG